MLSGKWFTAIHCLSSTCPNERLVWLFVESSATPPFPFTQCAPMSSEYDTSISPFGCRPPSQNALKGSVVWYTRPWVSQSTFGSVLFVQLGGMSCVPTVVHSYPCTWLFETGDPPRIVYEPRWK